MSKRSANFRVEHSTVRWFAAGLSTLSLIALTVTAWIWLYVRREQEILAGLVKHLPESDLAAAGEMSFDLRLQGGLSVLLVLNLIATAIGFGLLVRGYLQSEQSQRDVQVLSTNILANMDAGVITTDRFGLVTSINPSCCKLIGIPDDGSLNSIDELGPEHELLGKIRDEVGQSHQSVRDRDYTITRGGQVQTLRAGCILLRNRSGKEIGTAIHVRDVTRKSLMEDQLRRMERYMGIGSLAAGLQHEIKNPLSSLSLHIQLLCERLNEDSDSMPPDADVLEMLDVLRSEVNRISDVLDGFRSYASASEHKQLPVDIPEMIGKLARLLRPQTDSQGIRLKLDLPPKSLGIVEGDSVGLERVLLNLALNAIAAMSKGGELTFRVDKHDQKFRVVVGDTGHGITPEIRTQIFDPYFTTRAEGTGMGLAFCDKIIRQHKGTIDVHSGPTGSEFTILLPMVEDAA